MKMGRLRGVLTVRKLFIVLTARRFRPFALTVSRLRMGKSLTMPRSTLDKLVKMVTRPPPRVTPQLWGLKMV